MLCFAVKKSQDPCSVGILLIVSFTTALHQGHDLRVLLNDDVLKHVVIENLRHSLSLFKCAAMSL